MTRPVAPPRAPVVVGLWPRVGAGTVAAALHADEAAPGTMAADIAVCAGDDASLRRAESLCGASVLLVVLVEHGPPPSGARRRALARSHGVVAVLPHVPHWTGLADVPDEAATVLARHPDGLPPALRDYAGALRHTVGALVRGGGLTGPPPPNLRWARPHQTRPDRPRLHPTPPQATAERFARGRIVLGAPLGDTAPDGLPAATVHPFGGPPGNGHPHGDRPSAGRAPVRRCPDRGERRARAADRKTPEHHAPQHDVVEHRIPEHRIPAHRAPRPRDPAQWAPDQQPPDDEALEAAALAAGPPRPSAAATGR